MSAKKAIAGVAAVGAATLAAYLWVQPQPMKTQSPITESTSPAPVSSEKTTEEPTTVAPQEDREVATTRSEDPTPPADMSEEEAKRERRRLELERAAEQRFQQAVRMDGLKPSDIAPSVRAMFTTVKLEPVVDPANGTPGYVEGMRIAEIAGKNPLARAGFARGDRLTRINGEPLSDPAQIAHLFASLGQRFEVCAASAGGDRCRMVSLRPES